MPKRALAALLASAACALVVATPAQAERDYWYYAVADAGTPIRTQLPVYLQQAAPSASTDLTIVPTIRVNRTTIAELPTITVAAKPGLTRLSLTIPEDIIAQARAAGIDERTSFATLVLAVTGLPEGERGPVTESGVAAYLALDGGAVVGPQTLLGRSYQKGVPWRRIRYSVPTTWRATGPATYPGSTWPGLTTQLSEQCAAVVTGYATVIRTRRTQPQIKLQVRKRQPNVTDATASIAFGRNRYAVLNLTAVKGYGCDDSTTQALNDQLTSSLRTARLAQR